MKKIFTLFLIILGLNFSLKAQDPFIGEIRMFAGNYPPRGWTFCDGQMMSIAQNTALFSILGTTYGGNGQTNFALPDLRGRVPIHAGQGPGLTNRTLGEKAGTETYILNSNQMPSHSHTVRAVSAEGNQNTPANNLPADTKLLDKEYSNSTGNVSMNPAMLSSAGGNQPFPLMQPYTAVNFIIALEGIYPPRN